MLSDEDIKGCMQRGEIAFEPPIEADQLGPASIDLRLSDEFWVFKKSVMRKTLRLWEINHTKVTKRITRDEMTLAPGDLVLGKTVERIKLAPFLAGRLEGRSSYARLGVAVHITSSTIQPGSYNRQVLEIVNLAPFSITLRKGMRLCQVFFERLESPTSKPYAKFGKVAVDQ